MNDLHYLLDTMEQLETDLDRMETEYHAGARLRAREAKERRKRGRRRRFLRSLLSMGTVLILSAGVLFSLRMRLHQTAGETLLRLPGFGGAAADVPLSAEEMSLSGEAIPADGANPAAALTDAGDPAVTGGADSPARAGDAVQPEESGNNRSGLLPLFAGDPFSLHIVPDRRETPAGTDAHTGSGADGNSGAQSGADTGTDGEDSTQAQPDANGEDDTQSGMDAGSDTGTDGDTGTKIPAEPAPPPLFVPAATIRTVFLGEDADIDSQFAILADAETGEILAGRNMDQPISPASMTKVLTLLVAVEHITDWGAEGSVTPEISSYCYRHGLSIAGFAAWEAVPVRDLLYGCILPSGADACLALANLLAGSEEAFVVWMNERAAALGLSATTHFTNTIGMYHEDHHCTVRDLVVIMRAAMENPTCRKILGTRTHRTAGTEEHPEGLLLSNWFLRRIEDRFAGSNLALNGGKTGYVSQAGSCAVSLATREDGKEYLCATGKASGSWRAIHDHTILYQTFCGYAAQGR